MHHIYIYCNTVSCLVVAYLTVSPGFLQNNAAGEDQGAVPAGLPRPLQVLQQAAASAPAKGVRGAVCAGGDGALRHLRGQLRGPRQRHWGGGRALRAQRHGAGRPHEGLDAAQAGAAAERCD